MDREAHARADAAPLQPDRQQDQRRAIPARVGRGLLPEQEADREKQGVGAALGQIEPGLAIELDQLRVELGGVAGRQQFAPLQRRTRVGFVQHDAGALGMERRVAAGGAGEVGRADDAEAASLGQLVLQPRRIGTVEADRGRARLDVEQPVARGKVQQLALPALQSPFGGAGSRVRLGQVEVGERRRSFQRIAGRVRRRLRFWRHGGARVGHRERPDALHARAADIDRGDERAFALLVDQPGGVGDRAREAGGRCAGRQSRLEHDQLVQRDPLAQRSRVGDEQGRELLRLEPNAGKGVTLRHHQHRVQPRLFQRCGEQQRGVEAGREPALEHLARRADLLTLQLEAGGRLGIGQPQPGHRRPDCRRELVHAGARLGLVAIDAVGLARAAQHLACRLEQSADCGIVGKREGCEQLRHRRRSAPFVAGEQLHRHPLLGELQIRDLRPRRERHRRAHRLGQLQQQAGVERQIALAHPDFAAADDAVEPPLARREHRRVGLGGEHDPLDRRPAQVDQLQFAQHGHVVLVRREAQLGRDHRVDQQLAVGRCPHVLDRRRH